MSLPWLVTSGRVAGGKSPKPGGGFPLGSPGFTPRLRGASRDRRGAGRRNGSSCLAEARRRFVDPTRLDDLWIQVARAVDLLLLRLAGLLRQRKRLAGIAQRKLDRVAVARFDELAERGADRGG